MGLHFIDLDLKLCDVYFGYDEDEILRVFEIEFEGTFEGTHFLENSFFRKIHFFGKFGIKQIQKYGVLPDQNNERDEKRC